MFVGCEKNKNGEVDDIIEIGDTFLQSEDQSESINHEKTWNKAIRFDSNTTFLKLLGGRQRLTPTGVTCDWSCDGIEFIAECEGDIVVKVAVVSGSGCYFRVYVDGKEWSNINSPYFKCFAGISDEFIINDIPGGRHTIRIVKSTGYTLARTEFVSIMFENGAPLEQAPSGKELFIEYVGDSIFCGWGVVRTLAGTYNGTYQSQDGTLAVPYLISNRFDADYSVVAVSGQGAVYGDPNIENAYKYASYARDKTVEYGFERKADVVVVNVGTNDAASAGAVSADSFAASYKRMLQYIRAKNGDDCVIIAVYNMMNDGYGTYVENVINELGGEKDNYYIFKAERCSKVLNNAGHPTAKENVEYAQAIGDMISSIIK